MAKFSEKEIYIRDNDDKPKFVNPLQRIQTICVMPNILQSMDEMDFERGIWCAAKDGDLTSMQKFLDKKGVSPDAVDSYGYRAIHYAARNGHYNVCFQLLKHGANVNAVTRCLGATPLHRAVTQGHYKIVELLLEHGADPSIKDADGKTALDRMSAISNDDNLVAAVIVALLVEHCQRRGLNLSDDTERTERTINRFLGEDILAHFREGKLFHVSERLKHQL